MCLPVGYVAWSRILVPSKYIVSCRRYCQAVFLSGCTNIGSLRPRAAAVTLSFLVCVRLAFLYILRQLWCLSSSSSNLPFYFAFCCPCFLANCKPFVKNSFKSFACVCVCARAQVCPCTCRGYRSALSVVFHVMTALFF